MNFSYLLYFLMGILFLCTITVEAQNIGIGTTSPEGEFHVSKENVLVGPTFSGTGLNDIVVDFDASVEIITGVQYTIIVDNAGPVPNLIDIYSSANLLFDDLPMATSGIALESGISIGFQSLSGHTYDDSWFITIIPGNLNQFIVKGDKIGIGTATPGYTLDVEGDVNYTGNIYQNGNLFVPTTSINQLNDGINNNSNLFIGNLSGFQNSGSQNLFLGNNAGRLNTSGNNNVFLGFGSGEFNESGSGNVFIGNEIFSTGNESNRLKINNDESSRPLIYGEFDNKKVFINRNGSISSQEVFGISRDVTGTDYGGMYVETRGSNNSRPFYGFAVNSISKAWLEFDGTSEDIILNNYLGDFKLVYNTASKPVAGSWIANSDSRLKKNIKPLNKEEMLLKLLSMQGVSYEWNDDKTDFRRPEGEQIGFIAQDLREIWPEKVSEDHLGYLQTAYGDYDPVIVEAIKALNEKLELQAKEIELLKRRLDEKQ